MACLNTSATFGCKSFWNQHSWLQMSMIWQWQIVRMTLCQLCACAPVIVDVTCLGAEYRKTIALQVHDGVSWQHAPVSVAEVNCAALIVLLSQCDKAVFLGADLVDWFIRCCFTGFGQLMVSFLLICSSIISFLCHGCTCCSRGASCGAALVSAADPQLVPSKRGNPKLLYKGYMYVQRYEDKTHMKTWMCDNSLCKVLCKPNLGGFLFDLIDFEPKLLWVIFYLILLILGPNQFGLFFV